MADDKRLSEVIRVRKRQSNFVMMDKSFLEDTRLSYKAKGILAYLLGRPDNWKVIAGDLVNQSTDGKGSVYKGLAELREHGYYEKTPVRNDKGIIVRWDSVVFEIPNAGTIENSEVYPLPNNQEMDNPQMDNPFMENRERNKNYYNKDLNINNNQVQSCQEDQDGQTAITAYTNLIRENIKYDDLLLTCPDDIKLIDEFIDIILDALMSQGKTVRINGENKPRELVKHNLIRLTYDDIIHVLERFKSQESHVKKKPAYILTMLYHSKMELESHYTNLVQSNWGCQDV